MKSRLNSVITACALFGAIVFFAVRHVAPALPPFVGPPDFRDTRALTLPPAQHVVVSNADGAVRVDTAADAANVSVRADIRLYGGPETDKAALEACAAGLVQTTLADGRIEIVTEPGDRIAGVDLIVSYEILVPLGTDIDVVGSNGNVWIAEGCGRVAVHGGNSDIEIVEPQGIVIAKSANGRIKLVNGRENATLEAVNGSIFADMEDGTLDARTTNGHVIARLFSDNVDACDLESENGSITIELAYDTFQYDVETARGFIKSDFELDAGLGPGVLDTKRAEGQRGPAGSTLLMAKALNGNIWLKRK